MTIADKNGLTLMLPDDFIRSLIEQYEEDVSRLTEEVCDGDGRKFYYPEYPNAPTEKTLRELIETAFWASLLEEEGRHYGFSVLYETPVETSRFKKPIRLAPNDLARIATGLPTSALIGCRLKMPLRRERVTASAFGACTGSGPLGAMGSLVFPSKPLGPGRWLSAFQMGRAR